MSKVIKSIQDKKNKNDIYYTPLSVVLKMIEMCEITSEMSVLDPCLGGGIFYDNLPDCKKYFCEIEHNKDFFDWNQKVDLIIGNPPYSLWNKWIDHTMKYTDKFCYIFGFLNFTDDRLRRIINNGFSITQMHVCRIDWWFGTSFIVLFEKNKPSIISVESKRINCEVCGKRCGRGSKGNSPNICNLKQI